MAKYKWKQLSNEKNNSCDQNNNFKKDNALFKGSLNEAEGTFEKNAKGGLTGVWRKLKGCLQGRLKERQRQF